MPGGSRSAAQLRSTAEDGTAGGEHVDDFQTFFTNYEVRSPQEADTVLAEPLADSAVALRDACEASGGEVLYAVDPGAGHHVVVAAGVCVLGDTAEVETVQAAAGSDAETMRELHAFMALCLESACRRHARLPARVRVPRAVQAFMAVDLLLRNGFESDSDGSLSKEFEARAGIGPSLVASRAGDKGGSELLGVVDTSGREIAVLPREYVEKFNLLIPAIGVLVHNKRGEIYVHQRSALKSMHASYFDMFVGGLPLAGETVLAAACNEVREELGVCCDQFPLEPLFTVTWLGSRNRVILSVFRVCVHGDNDVVHNDGEVVWGKFMGLAELSNRMERDPFVPGGLKAWRETVARGIHTKYLS